MYIELIAVGGIFWTITYILIIIKGFKDKTYGMPAAALVGNITWEFLYTVKYIPPDIQFYNNIVWLSFDCIILYQLFKYWRTDITGISPRIFYPSMILFLITGLLIHYFIAKEFTPAIGAAYSGFGQNLLVSILFPFMLFRRQSLKGQSLSIAISKMIGTAGPAIAFYKYPVDLAGSKLMAFMFVTIFIFDLLYLICVILVRYGKLFSSQKREIVSGY
ncbi:MAG: hypothetical protein IPM56_11350 [Ignavibacteriales bacterium]|nr:MAG: hypothetical protein IPM56_11350 [Ignavibacteriales bacterium]